jgi:hypothetical protein
MKPHYFSRTAADTDDDCPRHRYWSTVYGGRGLETNEPKENLDFGTAAHRSLQSTWEQKPLVGVYDNFSLPLRWVGEGLAWAYSSSVYPRYREEGWKLLHAEKEVQAHIGFSPKGRELKLLAQPDLLLQHEETGINRYVEGKTSKLLTPAYFRSWRYNPQAAAGFEGVRQTLGIKVDDYVIQVLYKGTYDKEENRWLSEFVPAWYNPFLEKYAAKRPKNYANWKRVALEDVKVSPTEWFAGLDKHLLAQQVPETPPMVFDQKMVQGWLAARCKREGEIADTDPDNREAFEQRFKKCSPVMGFECPFLSLCWNSTEEKNPLANGKYRWRTPHHKTEEEALGAKS